MQQPERWLRQGPTSAWNFVKAAWTFRAMGVPLSPIG
jgi:hypothetical protein